MPGIFLLIDQNNWTRVAQRAKKYKSECRITGHVKRSSSLHIHNDGSGDMDMHMMDGHDDRHGDRHGDVERGIEAAMSFNTNVTSSTHATLPINNTSSANNTNGSSSSSSSFNTNTHVKCKALHHACHRLRRVHGHIRKKIAESLREGGNVNTNTNTKLSSFRSVSSFDSSDDGHGNANSNAYNMKSASGASQSFEQQEWDDPWIEACKAILAIIEQYPEAASHRESRHGCLPLHLAAFAMCPTPNVQSVQEKLALNTATENEGMGGAGEIDKHTFAIAEELSPPRPLAPPRQHSRHSSLGSVGSSSMGISIGGIGMGIGALSLSLDGYSANMEAELLSNANATSSTSVRDRDLSFTLEKLEAQLRSSPNGKLSSGDEAKMLESARMLSTKDTHIPRPPPLSSYSTSNSNSNNSADGGGYRSTSYGSQASNGSNSVMSAASSIYPSNSYSPSRKLNTFDLKKYIANEARREEYSLRVVNALLDAFPKAVKVDSEGGRLPLHTAVAGKATLKVIETLTRANPHACRHRNNENSLPLHLAACYGVSDVNIAPMLLKVYPDACMGKNRWERTPYEEALLMAGENGRMYQKELCLELRRLPSYWTSESAGRNGNGHGPQGQSSLGFGDIEHLLTGEWATGNRNGNYDDRSDTKSSDLDVNDLFALIKERKWDLIVENIDFLQSQANKRIECEVRAGYTANVSALYLACEQEPTYEALDALVSACPGSTSWRKQPGGELPLHAACTWGASSAVVGFLLAASPDSARQREALCGNLPLHCACFSGASEDIIESLLCTHPKAAGGRNVQGSTPRDIVCRLSHANRKEILNLIESVSLELLKKKRHYDNQKQIDQRITAQLENITQVKDKGSTVSNARKSILNLSKKKDKNKNAKDDAEQYNDNGRGLVKERMMNITRSDPPDEDIEVELTEGSNDGMLWV